MNIEPIAYIHTDFDEKFGIPRQSGRVRSLTGRIVFVPEYRKPEALRGIDGFSHLWLLFDFSLAHREGWSPTVRPAETRRKYAHRSFCKPFAVQTQQHRIVLRAV